MAARVTPSAGRKSDKLWRDAIALAVNREVEKGKKQKLLAKAAEKLVALAVEGDVGALKELGDRLDGKSIQGVQQVGDNVVRVIISDEHDVE